MFDLSSKFNTFYNDHVVLPKTEQDKLHNKKLLNIQRLKDGLKEYNEEKKTVRRLTRSKHGMAFLITISGMNKWLRLPVILQTWCSNLFVLSLIPNSLSRICIR